MISPILSPVDGCRHIKREQKVTTTSKGRGGAMARFGMMASRNTAAKVLSMLLIDCSIVSSRGSSGDVKLYRSSTETTLRVGRFRQRWVERRYTHTPRLPGS